MPEFADKDACQLLDADHIAVKHLFVDYARTAAALASQSTDDRRTQLAMEICDELTVHAQIEEEIFYPALRAAFPADGPVLDDAEAEHQEAKQLIADIRGIGQANDAMDTLVAELNTAVEHHVKEERDQLFPRAKTAPGLDLVDLGARLRERQLQLKQEKQEKPEKQGRPAPARTMPAL